MSVQIPRFNLLEPHELDELFSSRRAQGTKKVIKSAEDVFIEFLQVKGISVESCMHSNDVLDNAVKEFFITVKRKDGERYKSKSLHTLKYGVKQKTETENRKQLSVCRRHVTWLWLYIQYIQLYHDICVWIFFYYGMNE